MIYEWDDTKRESNIAKHGLDLANGYLVYESRYRLDIPSGRESEARVQSLAYVCDRLAVLSLVHADRNDRVRLISLRYASTLEREIYHEWLENYPHDL